MPDNESHGRFTGVTALDDAILCVESGQASNAMIQKLVDALPESFVRELVHSRVGFDGQIIANLKEVQYRARQLVDEAFDPTPELDTRGNPVPGVDKIDRDEALKLLDSANTKMIKYGSEILSMERINKIEQTILSVVRQFLSDTQWDRLMTELDHALHPIE